MEDGIGGAAFAAIVRASLDAIIVADSEGRVLEFNPAAERMFGWSRSEALGESIGALIVPPLLRRRHERGMKRMRDGAPPRMTERAVEMEALRRDGSLFPCAL
jgi:PAS domain S-box-containing protein